jgi:hypothetical protein
MQYLVFCPACQYEWLSSKTKQHVLCKHVGHALLGPAGSIVVEDVLASDGDSARNATM